MDSIKNAAIIEPLNRATEHALRRIETLTPDDELLIRLDDHGKDFIYTAVRWETNREGQRVHSRHRTNRDLDKFIQWRLPESEWLGKRDFNKRRMWRVGGTDVSVLITLSAIPREHLKFENEESELKFQLLWKRFVAQDSRAAMQAAYKLGGTAPEVPADWVDHPQFPLSPYQRVAVQMSLGQEATGLFMDRGTGKTATVIQRMCMEAKRLRAKEPKRMMRALIVVPNQVRMNWEREVEKFTVLPGKISVIRGTQEKRVRALVQAITTEEDCHFSAVIIGYDSLVASINQFAKPGLWDLLVLDESHFIKSHSTKRWKAIEKLRDCARQRMALTGTPIGNSFQDLWTQLEFLGRGLSGFSKFSAFRQFYGVWVEAGMNGMTKLAGMKNKALLQERLSRLTFSVTKDEAGLNLPSKVYDVHEVEMTKPQAEAYKAMAEHLMLELEDKMSGEVDPVTAQNVLTQLLRLAQITSGHTVVDAQIDPHSGEELRARVTRRLGDVNPKIDAVMDLLTDEQRDPNGKTLIWCCFTEDIRAISERLTAEGIKHGTYYGATPQAERDRCVEQFNNDDEYKVLVLNPQTAGEGLNLVGYSSEDHKGYCDHEIFFSQNWSAILRGQAEDRAHRRGTRMPVRITDLTVPGTIDEDIRDRVQGKLSSADALTDIKEILRSVLGMRA
jgi:SNF2 family DNA or RNA helicase